MKRGVADDWLTIDQAAEALGVSKSTLYRWRDEGRVVFYHFGPRVVRVRADDLRDLARPHLRRHASPQPAAEGSGGSGGPEATARGLLARAGEPAAERREGTAAERMATTAQEIGEAVTWDQLTRVATEGLWVTFGLTAALVCLRLRPDRQSPDLPLEAQTNGSAAPGATALRVLALPNNWLGARPSWQDVAQWPYVAVVIDQAEAELVGGEAGGPGSSAESAIVLEPALTAILPLNGDAPDAQRQTVPGVVAAAPIRGRSFEGVLVIADPRAGLSADEGNRMLHLWSMLLAQAVDNVWRVGEYERLALTDHLTGLSNRRAFDHTMGRELARTRRYGRPVSLVLIDLDDFRRINDVYGHPGGDEALRAIGAWLRARVRKSDLVARVGGDEFAVICSDTGATGAAVLAERLIESLAQLRVIDDRRLGLPGSARVSASVGVAEAANDDMTISELYRRADVALYSAKRAGAGSVRVYSEELDRRAGGAGTPCD